MFFVHFYTYTFYYVLSLVGHRITHVLTHLECRSYVHCPTVSFGSVGFFRRRYTGHPNHEREAELEIIVEAHLHEFPTLLYVVPSGPFL